ncbi:hypothetical protein BaRGS_00004048, partial [Batillaria attramentaria]
SASIRRGSDTGRGEAGLENRSGGEIGQPSVDTGCLGLLLLDRRFDFVLDTV